MALFKKLTTIVDRIDPKTGLVVKKEKDKHYLILVVFNNDEEDNGRTWEFIKGRNDTFANIVDNLETYDLLESHVLSDTVSPNNAVSAYSFIRLCLESGKVPKDFSDNKDIDLAILEEFMENYYQKGEEELNQLYSDDINSEVDSDNEE